MHIKRLYLTNAIFVFSVNKERSEKDFLTIKISIG